MLRVFLRKIILSDNAVNLSARGRMSSLSKKELEHDDIYAEINVE